MIPREETPELSPRIVFAMEAILEAMGREKDDRAFQDLGELLSMDIIAESFRDVTGVAPPTPPEGQLHSLFPAAGMGDLIFFLERLQPWLGTAADLAQLGALALLIVDKLRERTGRDKRVAAFSRDILEGMCLRRLDERLGLDLSRLSVRSQGLSRFSGEPIPPEDPPYGVEIHLVWISTEKDTHLFLIDCWGKIWGEW